jgi:hypothetical protein
MMRRLRVLGLGIALVLGALAGVGAAYAADGVAVSVSVRPGVAKLGERVAYRGRVVVPKGTAVRWLSPETSEPLTWGPRQTARRSGRMDTVTVSIPLQAFDLGELAIPGLRFELQPPGQGPALHRLPVTRLRVVSVLTAADSSGRFRELHGPIAAPWWERVPWLWVTIGLLLVALIVVWLVWLRRRRPRVVPAPVAVPAAVTRHPMAEALAALQALRARRLPESGRFADHAFELGQILRRFLEATTASRPGQTTPELVAHLRDAGLAEPDVTRFRGLLEGWDRVKFAREAPTVEDATRTESAVEAFVRRPPPGQEAKVA